MARWIVCHPGPEWSVADVYNGWTEALAAHGQEIVQYNLGDRISFYDAARLEQDDGTYIKPLDDREVASLALNGLAAQMWKTRPQVLFLISGFFADPAMLDHARNLGIRVVILHTECPYEDDRQVLMAAHADLNMVNEPLSVARFEKVAPAVYCPHGYRPALHQPGPPDPSMVCDLAFVGTAFKSRIMFFEEMDLSGLDFILGGSWSALPLSSPLHRYLGHHSGDMLDNTEVPNLYRSMRAGINIYRREGNADDLLVGHGVGPREVEMAACGAFFLRDRRPEGDELFPSLPTFDGPGDASEKLRWWLAHDDERAAAAAKAHEAVAGRTFANHAAELLRLLQIEE